MIGKTLAAAAALLFAAQVHAQTTQTNPSASPGTTSGPAAGSPTSMQSPQAGSLETKHQRKAVREQSRSVRGQSRQTARPHNDQTGATGSSSPSYAPPPK
jgi:hypothetical protein